MPPLTSSQIVTRHQVSEIPVYADGAIGKYKLLKVESNQKGVKKHLLNTL